jgi:DamX protein
MSLARDHRVLELSSQAALLERISLLTNFGSNFIHVFGEKGAGKTWLAQRYLEAWAQDKNQSLLLCYHSQSDAQRRHTILSQLRSNESFDPDADLVESFYQLMEDDSCNIVIVVDDAQQLSEIMIGELWMLVLEAQSQPKWTISVVLFALPKLLDRLLGRLSHGQEHKPIDLEIETLSHNDADRFFEFSVMRFVSDEMEQAVRIAYSKARKLPGEIMALGELKMEKRIIIRSIVGSPINIAIIVVLLALTMGGGYWWLLNQMSTPTMDNSTANQEQMTDETSAVASNLPPSNLQQEQTAIPTLTNNSVNSGMNTQLQSQSDSAAASTSTSDADLGDVSLNASGQAISGGANDTRVNSVATGTATALSQVVPSSVNPDPNADDDSHSLPPSVAGNGDNVGIDDADRQRVVITSDVVDALMDNPAKPAHQVDIAAINAGLLSASSSAVKNANEVVVSTTTNQGTVITSADATDAQLEQLAQAVSEPSIEAPTPPPQLVTSDVVDDGVISVVQAPDSPAPKITSAPTSDESRLLAMPERSYTLQLAAFNDPEDVSRFINTNFLNDKANVYKTVRQDVMWLIVTYDNFSTLQLARDAVETLPRPVQALSPWAKSLRQVHREIELGK